MKSALFVLLSCATFSMAQDMKLAPSQKSLPAPQAQTPGNSQADAGAPAPEEFKRLASVTWDLNTHKLVWVVEKGIEVNGEFVAQSTGRFEVSPSEAFMKVEEQKRAIGGDEASSLHDLLGVLSLYCVESTVWWENGGDDASPAAAPDTPGAAKPGKKTEDRKADPNAKPTRVDQPAEKPAIKLIPGALVADAAVVK